MLIWFALYTILYAPNSKWYYSSLFFHLIQISIFSRFRNTFLFWCYCCCCHSTCLFYIYLIICIMMVQYLYMDLSKRKIISSKKKSKKALCCISFVCIKHLTMGHTWFVKPISISLKFGSKKSISFVVT